MRVDCAEGQRDQVDLGRNEISQGEMRRQYKKFLETGNDQ